MIIEKTCVGCGTTFTCMEELAEETLYCSNVCENNHSIFKELKESQTQISEG